MTRIQPNQNLNRYIISFNDALMQLMFCEKRSRIVLYNEYISFTVDIFVVRLFICAVSKGFEEPLNENN